MATAFKTLLILSILLFPALDNAQAESSREQARHFAGDLGAIVQRDEGGRFKGTLFRVWAPNAESVSVIGTFNNWNGNRHKMERINGGAWEAFIPNAKAGDEYLFLINGELRRKDPRARQVTASDGNCVIYDTAAFDWGETAKRKSSGSLKDLVIYQLHIGAFHDPNPGDGEPGTFADAIKKLDHLKKLGVNCVLVLPVAEFHGKHSWGYNPSDPFAIESAYGGPDGFKEFVKACHERDIAVHVDIVHNHYGPQDLDLVRFDGKGGGETNNGIYFYSDSERGETPWGPRPDFGRREVRDYIRDNVRMWFLEYKVDGLRWDSTINIRATSNGRSINPDGESLLHQISTMIEKEFPGKISIAEDSVGDPRFQSSWEYDFHHSGDKTAGIMPTIFRNPESARRVSDIGSRIKTDLGFRRVIYSENHDEVGRLNENHRLLVEADENDPLSLEARRRAALAAVVTLTSPGVPLVFMGQELLETREFHDSNALDWSGDDLALHNFQLYRDLVHLRRNLEGKSASLTDVRARVVKADEQNKLLTWRRYLPGRAKDDLFIVANFSSKPLEKLPVYFPQSGEWSLLLNTDDPKYGADFTGLRPDLLRTNSSCQLLVNIAPFSAQIYGLSKYEPAELDLAAMREEWQAAHGEEKSTSDPTESIPDEVWEQTAQEEFLEPETPAEPEYVPFQSKAGSYVVLANFSMPKPWDPANPDFKMGLVADNLWRCGMGFANGVNIAFKILDPATGTQYGG
ncbi:MAG: alpha-amylase family glycosyl hydrolase, partial [Verrucomicrobiota bacterium]